MNSSSVTPSSRPALAEDLLLLLFQPGSGTIAGESTLFYSLAGGVLAELAMQGQVDLVEPTGRGRKRLRTTDEAGPNDDILRSAWDYIGDKPRAVQTVLAAIGPPLREPLLERLVQRGDIRRVARRSLVVFHTTALEDGENGRRDQLVDSVRGVLVDGREPTARVAALAALLSGSGVLPQLHREIPWTSAVITRAKELEKGNWGAGAAGEAVTRTVTATVVSNAVIAATVPNLRA